MMDIELRKKQTETSIFRCVFSSDTNHYHTLHGGKAMHMMDEVAFIAATRFSRLNMVTVSTDKINFNKPIPAGSILELVARVTDVGRTSMKVNVEIYIESMNDDKRELAINGVLTFVAVDEHKQPVPIIEHLTKMLQR